MPASVSTLTKHRLRPPASTKKLWMSVIFSSGLPVYRGEACDIACACKGNPIVPPWTRNSRRFMGRIVPFQRGHRVIFSDEKSLARLLQHDGRGKYVYAETCGRGRLMGV